LTQRLYAIGLSLQAAALHLPPEYADRLESLVDALDDAIREIRTSIFALHPPRLGTSGLRRAVNERVKEATRLLGFPPKLRLEGPLDAVADPDVAAECLATLQEALSNVVRHSRATNVEVELVAEGGALRLVVTDDGVGLPADAGERGGSGLHNVVERAARLGGYAEYHRGSGGVGTVLVWSVPLRRP
jgi:signal transduction histidine kinase